MTVFCVYNILDCFLMISLKSTGLIRVKYIVSYINVHILTHEIKQGTI